MVNWSCTQAHLRSKQAHKSPAWLREVSRTSDWFVAAEAGEVTGNKKRRITFFAQKNTGVFPSISVLHVTRVVGQVCLLYSVKDQCQLNFFFSKMFSEEPERKDTAFALTELIWMADSQKHYGFSAPDNVPWPPSLLEKDLKGDSCCLKETSQCHFSYHQKAFSPAMSSEELNQVQE